MGEFFESESGRPPLTTEQMRALEEAGVSIGVSRLMMMENAGNAIGKCVLELASRLNYGNPPEKVRVMIVAGVGNNGGDAFVAARHLSYWKHCLEISVFILGEESSIKTEEARINWGILKRIDSIRKTFVNSMEKIPTFADELADSQIVVVGIFGTGFRGEPRENQKQVMEAINRSQAKRISIDIPSGMEADTGKSDFAIESEITVTMHAPKVGMLSSGSARKKCGKIFVANIGLPLA